MSRFLSEQFSTLAPYTPGEQPRGGRLIKLNTNENPYPPAPGVLQAIDRPQLSLLKLYSDPDATLLIEAIARQYRLSPDQVFVGNGSDEVLAFAFLAFGGREKGFAAPSLSYSFYPVFARLFELPLQTVPLRADLSIDPADYLHCGRNIVFANPNAPTGLALSRAAIEQILQANPDNLVIVDEAYIDFGGESMVPLIGRYENLLVVQTFSKSRALAGMRIGMALGSAPLIGDLQRIKFSFNPYSLDRLALLAGTAAMEDDAYMRSCVARICATRQRVTARLRELGFTLADSSTNFVFAKPPRGGGKALYEALRSRGILLRRWDDPPIADYLRISIGSEEEMEEFLQAVEELLGQTV